MGANWTSAHARESLERLKSIGINFVYTHNYDCQPGAHLSFAEILRAADDAGMLVALSEDVHSGIVSLGGDDLVCIAAAGANVHFGAQLIQL